MVKECCQSPCCRAVSWPAILKPLACSPTQPNPAIVDCVTYKDTERERTVVGADAVLALHMVATAVSLNKERQLERFGTSQHLGDVCW